jgi:hypothetical protein
MQPLLAAIITWLSVNFSLPANYDLPAIEFATPTEITKLRYGAFNTGTPRSDPAASASSSVVSVYKDKDRVIAGRMAGHHTGRAVNLGPRDGPSSTKRRPVDLCLPPRARGVGLQGAGSMVAAVRQGSCGRIRTRWVYDFGKIQVH